jgi:hypothetical protein
MIEKPEELINFHGQDWKLFKIWLERYKDRKVSMLIANGTSHDKSNEIRGSLATISQILALEPAALRAANQGIDE